MTTDPEKPRDNCADLGRPQDKPSLDEMHDVLESEAARIAGSQTALIEGGYRTTRDPGQMRKVVVIRAAADLVDLFRTHREGFLRVVRAAQSSAYRSRSGP